MKARAAAPEEESVRGEPAMCSSFGKAYPSARMTASALVTTATFCIA